MYFIYILASQKKGTIYIGITDNLLRRVYEHKNNMVEGFTQKYKIHLLVYFEQFTNVIDAIVREKQLKKWNRKWKIELIERNNPEWSDLYEAIKR